MGVAFGPYKSADSDMTICHNTTCVGDFIFTKSHSVKADTNIVSDKTLVSADVTNGIFTCTYSQKLVTTDPEDYSIFEGINTIEWAIGKSATDWSHTSSTRGKCNATFVRPVTNTTNTTNTTTTNTTNTTATNTTNTTNTSNINTTNTTATNNTNTTNTTNSTASNTTNATANQTNTTNNIA